MKEIRQTIFVQHVILNIQIIVNIIMIIVTIQAINYYILQIKQILHQYRQQNEALACLESGIEFNLQLYDISNKIGDGLFFIMSVLFIRRLLKDTEAVQHFQKGLKIKEKNIKLLKLKCEILQKRLFI